MGLSAFGNPKYYDVLKKNCFINDDIYKLNLDLFEFHKKNFSYNFEGQPNQKFLLNKKIYEIFNDNINYSTNDKDFAKDIASSTQKIFEETLFKIISSYKNKNENPMPRSPVQSARKFSAVLGTTSARSVISIRPADFPSMVISKYTTGFGMARACVGAA